MNQQFIRLWRLSLEFYQNYFFTERGYKYISEDLQIKDPELRKQCYEYLKGNIKHYNNGRVYKVDESIYSRFYEPLEDDDFDDDDSFVDDDKIRGEVDIYGVDIDNYDIIFYSTTLLTVMLRFVKNREYDKLKRLIDIDNAITNNHFYYDYDKTLVEAVYQPKAMEDDLHDEIAPGEKGDYYLNFFLSENEFTRQYNIEHLALIISHCFDAFDPNPMEKIYKNIDNINAALKITVNPYISTSINMNDERIKRLVKVRRDNS